MLQSKYVLKLTFSSCKQETKGLALIVLFLQGYWAGRDDDEGKWWRLYRSALRWYSCSVNLSAVLQQEQKKMPEAIQYIEKACMMYMENGTPDTAAMALDRAGK